MRGETQSPQTLLVLSSVPGCFRQVQQTKKSRSWSGVAAQTQRAADLPRWSGEGVSNKSCCSLCPHKNQMPKHTHTHTHTCSSPRWAHPALQTLGRVRPQLKAAQERQRHEAALPSAPPAQCSRDGGAQPSPVSPAQFLPQILLVKPLASALREGPIRGACLPDEGLPHAGLHGGAGARVGTALLGAGCLGLPRAGRRS